VWADGVHENTHKKVLTPGVYPNLGWVAYESGAGMNDNISNIQVRLKIPHHDWLAKCCTGQISPSSTCVNFADSAGPDCKTLMRKHCTASNANFFGTECKRWTQNQNDDLKNVMGREMCPKAKTPEEKDWCACFIPRDIPPELENDLAIKALWPCLDPACNDSTKSLQPYMKSCPNTLSICEQEDITTKLSESELGNQRITNECGNINITSGDATASPPPPDESTTTSPSRTTSTTEKATAAPKWLIGGGVALGVVVLILTIVVVVMMINRRKG
jgi:hypothetical protein